MHKIADFIDRVENITLVWTILGLAFIGFVQVICRYLFNYSFTWFEEFGRFMGVFLAFLGAGIGVKTGSHFTMDLVVIHLKPPWQQLLRSLTSAGCGVFFFFVAWFSVKIVSRMYGYETTSPTMEIPMYIPYLPIPVFSVVMGIRFCILSVVCVRQAFPGSLPHRDGDPEGETAS